jgi:hypothetical protein
LPRSKHALAKRTSVHRCRSLRSALLQNDNKREERGRASIKEANE